MGVSSCNLSHFFVRLLLKDERPGTQLTVIVVVTQLALVATTPSVDLAERRLSYGMLEATFDLVYLLSDVSEALDEFREFSGIGVPKTKLPVFVVLSE